MRPMGLWSRAITLSTYSSPSIFSHLPGLALLRFFSEARVLYSTSLISEDLPLPETPVTQISFPRGISTSMFLRLFSLAPRIQMLRPLPALRLSGSGMRFLPLKYCPVTDSSQAQMSSTVPAQTTRPPLMPAPGPMSITWSASRMVSSSCSTTIRVLPRSRSCLSVLRSLALSR